MATTTTRRQQRWLDRVSVPAAREERAARPAEAAVATATNGSRGRVRWVDSVRPAQAATLGQGGNAATVPPTVTLNAPGAMGHPQTGETAMEPALQLDPTARARLALLEGSSSSGDDDSDTEDGGNDELSIHDTLGTLSRQVQQMVDRSISKSTAAQRKSVATQFLLWLSKMSLEVSEISATLYLQDRLQKKSLEPASLVQYGSILRIMITRMQKPTDYLTTYIRGVRKTMGMAPSSQALPMTREMVRRIVDHLRQSEDLIVIRIALLITLCYETASRVSDVLHLTRESFIFQEGLTIVFGRTKGNVSAAPRMDHLVFFDKEVITDFHDWMKEIPTGQQAFPGVTAKLVSRTLRQVVVPEGYAGSWLKLKPGSLVKPYFTNHSMKRGAITTLWRCAARGLVVPEMIPCLAKHVPQNPQFPSITIGYAADLTAVAKAGGSGSLTRHLVTSKYLHGQDLPDGAMAGIGNFLLT